MLMEQVLSYKQLHVCNDIHIDVCFEIEKGEMNIHQNTKQHQNTKHAARKTQIDRQAGKKKTYTHDTDS